MAVLFPVTTDSNLSMSRDNRLTTLVISCQREGLLRGEMGILHKTLLSQSPEKRASPDKKASIFAPVATCA